jgi:hypothetical protein
VPRSALAPQKAHQGHSVAAVRRGKVSRAPSIRQTPPRISKLVSHATLPVIFDPRTRLAHVVLAFLTLVAPAHAETRGLFRIERSTNRNVVEYDLRLSRDGAPHPTAPVSVYWILLEDGGRREGLTFFERKFAYGVDVSAVADGLVLHLAAVPDRAVRVRRRGQRWEAQTIIGGKLATLRKIWVECDGGLFGPTVRFVELTGIDVETGQLRSEKLEG